MIGARRAFAIVSGAVVILVTAALGVRAQGPRRSFASGELGEAAIVAALASAPPERFRAVGSSSLVFQAELAGTIDAAFRPESRTHPRGWLAEVAAYRVALELGIDDVPPAVLRSIDRVALRRALDPEVDFDELTRELVLTGNVARGAFVYWVPGMLRSDLDTPEGIARWRAWLAQGGAIPEGDLALARDLSNVLVFDYLIANRDRWSGGNVRPLPNGRLVIRDHNLAFPFALGEGVQARMLDTLRRTTRFSRATIEHLIALDEEALRAALAADEPSVLLEDRQIAGVLERRETLLSYVGALIEAHGEEAVLYFE
ncbi:hypothetical protein [Sandaracinus amylolyticus]|uniref:FAM20 C-terminal domain-containing protein n=1 Tax=Sandaracinus amylolyticus TaxID=927083 RepID=A0A0F6W7Z6_9BACT|nr:hypothetical protein [Sandaracinus amylolyticus]AKF09742.1 hypothetical protein DB32_006891 [Sandaracinus amylolyticus]